MKSYKLQTAKDKLEFQNLSKSCDYSNIKELENKNKLLED